MIGVEILNHTAIHHNYIGLCFLVACLIIIFRLEKARIAHKDSTVSNLQRTISQIKCTIGHIYCSIEPSKGTSLAT